LRLLPVGIGIRKAQIATNRVGHRWKPALPVVAVESVVGKLMRFPRLGSGDPEVGLPTLRENEMFRQGRDIQKNCGTLDEEGESVQLDDCRQ